MEKELEDKEINSLIMIKCSNCLSLFYAKKKDVESVISDNNCPFCDMSDCLSIGDEQDKDSTS